MIQEQPASPPENGIRTPLMTGLPSGLHLPTPESRAEIGKTLGLNEKQQQVLFRAVLAGLKDLERYQTSKAHRPEQIKSLKKLAAGVSAFRKVLDEISRDVDLGDILPNALLERLGEMVTFATLQALLPRNRFSNVADIAEKDAIASKPITIESFESATLPHRRTLGLLSGDEILRKVVDVVDGAVQPWALEISVRKNGRPREIERDYMIEILAKACPEVLGIVPPVAASGEFVLLCELVLKSCGFGDDGVDKAVYRLLERNHRKQDHGDEP